MLITHSLAPPRSIRPLHRPVAAPTFPMNATGTNAMWKSAREGTFRRGVCRATVARARGEAPSGPRWAAPGLRAVPRSVSPVLQSHGRKGRQAGRQKGAGRGQAGRQAGNQAGRLAGAGSTGIPICTYIEDQIYCPRINTPIHIGGDNKPTYFSVSGGTALRYFRREDHESRLFQDFLFLVLR